MLYAAASPADMPRLDLEASRQAACETAQAAESDPLAGVAQQVALTGVPACLAMQFPVPAAQRIAVRVAPEAERALRRGHPWVFERSIRQQSHDGRPGDLVVIFDRKRRFLAAGLYDPHSSIRVRVLVHGEPAAIDREWYSAKLAVAAGSPCTKTRTRIDE